MISAIKGQLVAKKPPYVFIECASGLTYEVAVSMNTMYQLNDQTNISLYTHFVVREDTQQLYGFHDVDERKLFQTLIKVNGVGPKLAISILSSISVADFVFCVKQEDTARLIKLPGIGKKTAERLVVEMQDRLDDWANDLTDVNITGEAISGNVISRRATIQDAVSALIALGYKPPQASRAVSFVDSDDKSTEELIRDALKSISDTEQRGAA